MTVERIGDATLYLGDCLAILPTLGPIDAVFTSPPYNLGNTSGGGMPGKKFGHYSAEVGLGQRGGCGKWSGGALAHGYEKYNDARSHTEYIEWQKKIVSLCWDRLSKAGAIFYNHKPRIFDGILVTPIEYLPALPIRQIVIWARAGGINFSSAFYLPTHEWIVIIAKPSFRLKSKGASGIGDVWYIPQEANTSHPAPFPLALPSRAIETIDAGIVLDPFMGSGTTGVACINLGRRFIGIEIEEKYFMIACRRIREAWESRPRLFAEPPQARQLTLEEA